MIRIVGIGHILERVSGYFILLWGWKRAVCALIAGALTALALPPFNVFVVPFFTLPVFVWLLDATAGDPGSGTGARFFRGLAIGWWFGFGYFVAGLWWIGLALLVEADRFAIWIPVAVAGLPAILALFWGIACGFAILFWHEGWPRILLFAACLGGAEYLRGFLFTGFPWNELGLAAMPYPVVMQSAALIGTDGVTVIAIAVFAIAAAGPFHRVLPRLFASACALAVLAHIGFGIFRLHAIAPEFVADVKIRLVQPAIAQDEKWSTEFADRSFRKLLDLSNPGGKADGLDGIDLLIWPESAFAFVLTERPDALGAIAGLLPEDTQLVTGALRLERTSENEQPRAFNSAYVINSDGEIVGASDKTHLVPFGEYMPFAGLARRIGLRQLAQAIGGFEAGAGPSPIKLGRAGNMLTLICYEAIFPGLIANAPRPDFIVNLTNDAWFGNTPGPYQHWHQAVLRGVEFGLPVVRVANSGISSVTDPAGRIVGKLAFGTAGQLDSQLPKPVPATPYAIHGDWAFALLFGAFAFAGLVIRRS